MSTLSMSAIAHAETTYLIDPAKGDDSNPIGKPWKTFGKLNSIKLLPNDTVVISPGVQEETLMPSVAGTRDKPVTIQFLPGVHTIASKKRPALADFRVQCSRHY